MTDLSREQLEKALEDIDIDLGFRGHPVYADDVIRDVAITALHALEREERLRETLEKIANCGWYPECSGQCGADLAGCCDKRKAAKALQGGAA